MRRALIVVALLAGCATTSPKNDLADVRSMVADHAPRRTTLPNEEATEAVSRRTGELLSRPLDATAAVELALLHNRKLAATLEEVGIARADLVQAGLLQNPTLTAGLGFPLGVGVLAPQVGVSFDLLGDYLLPLRKKLAGHELEAAKLRVGDSVLDLIAQVQEALVLLQAKLEMLELLREIVESERQAAGLARRQFDAGNVNALELSVREAAASEARLTLQRTELDVQSDREALWRLMGLSGIADGWSASPTLPPLPASEPEVGHLEELAVARRLDLQAANEEVLAREGAVQLASSGRYTPNLSAGVNLARDAEGATTHGPTHGLSLPIFDQGQARVARVNAELKQSRARRDELELDIRSEARIGHARLRAMRALAEEYREVLVPLRARAVDLTQRHYNSMLLGVFALLESKRSELATDQAYIESVRDYWIARIRLVRTIAGPLVAETAKHSVADVEGGRP
jgi:cobalt-zinc-cadmium efflux system outer membrane protein